MGISLSKVRGKINLAGPEAGVNLKGSVISNADPSGTFKSLFHCCSLSPSSPFIQCVCTMQEKGRAGGGQLWVAQTIIKQFGKRRLQVKEQQAVQCFRLELFKVDTRDFRLKISAVPAAL